MEFFVFSNIQLPVTSLFPVLSEFNLDCKLENISNVSLFSEIPGTVKNTTLENCTCLLNIAAVNILDYFSYKLQVILKEFLLTKLLLLLRRKAAY